MFVPQLTYSIENNPHITAMWPHLPGYTHKNIVGASLSEYSARSTPVLHLTGQMLNAQRRYLQQPRPLEACRYGKLTHRQITGGKSQRSMNEDLEQCMAQQGACSIHA